ncbi:hypothetical protein BCV71DRAFT_281824 [Rhizopus microsporus]|uniref:Retrotransposon gag domain-containing protein n=1 Tax=Rhizopus microsporus TaxID=58291 RepID=A0A1X0RJW5_RHIZD|nr:hypothetical protein BCV71DRAFT_281824 [Rhizopus microsporus]
MSIINQSSISSLSSVAIEMATSCASPSNSTVGIFAQVPFSTQSTNNMDVDYVSPLSVSSAGSMLTLLLLSLTLVLIDSDWRFKIFSSQLVSLGSEVSEYAQAIRTAFEVRSRDLTNMAKLYEMMNNFSGSYASSSRGTSAVASSAPIVTPATPRTYGCPKEVPYFQWVGDVIFCYQLDINTNWYHLMITHIDPDQHLLLRQFLESSGKPTSAVTWDEFKSALFQNYGLTFQYHKIKANEELHSLHFKEHKETIEQFLDRFHALRIRFGACDSHVLISYLLRALPSDLKSEFAPSSSAGSTGNQKSKSNKFCSFHRVTIHNTEGCQARKKGEEPKAKNRCRRCGSPGCPRHRCNTAVRSGSSCSGDVIVRTLSASSAGNPSS